MRAMRAGRLGPLVLAAVLLLMSGAARAAEIPGAGVLRLNCNKLTDAPSRTFRMGVRSMRRRFLWMQT